MKTRSIILNPHEARGFSHHGQTQIRRAVKPQPPEWVNSPEAAVGERVSFEGWHPVGLCGHPMCACIRHRHGGGESLWTIRCPYGQPGDRLIGKETWRTGWSYGGDYPTVQYKATESALIGSEEHPILDVVAGKFGTGGHESHAIVAKGRWRSSVHMPRWASRIHLEIVRVWVERLQDISEEDARAEGIADGGCINCGESEPCGCSLPTPSARDAFIYLWESINGPGSWEASPWVWVVEFRRVEGGES